MLGCKLSVSYLLWLFFITVAIVFVPALFVSAAMSFVFESSSLFLFFIRLLLFFFFCCFFERLLDIRVSFSRDCGMLSVLLKFTGGY